MSWTKFVLPILLVAAPVTMAADKSLSARLWEATDARNADDDSFKLALSEGTSEEKRIALLGLGRIGGDAVVDRLRVFLNAEPILQRTALFALGISASEKSTVPLQQAWLKNEINTANRDVALLAIANTGNDTAQTIFLNTLLDSLEHGDHAITASVAQAFGLLWTFRRDKLTTLNKDAARLLLQVVSDRNAASTYAAFALSRGRNEAELYDLDEVFVQLKNKPDPRTALFLARAYGTPASVKDSTKVFELAQLHTHAWVRYESAFAVARTKDESIAWRGVNQLIRHPDPMTAIAAIQGLSERPPLVTQHRKEVEAWASNSALKYSVKRALPIESASPEREDPPQKVFDYDAIRPLIAARYLIKTERGDLTVQLSAESPYTSYNFATLANKGYFNGRVFFRVVPGFVAQTGDPTDTGEGGPGYRIREELSLNPHTEHWLGMATAGKDTAGSQFFFNVGHNPHLDWHYTTFAKIESGVEVIGKLTPGDRIVSVSRVN